MTLPFGRDQNETCKRCHLRTAGPHLGDTHHVVGGQHMHVWVGAASLDSVGAFGGEQAQEAGMSACPTCGSPEPHLHPSEPIRVCPNRWHGASDVKRMQSAYAMAGWLGLLILLPRGMVEVMVLLSYL